VASGDLMARFVAGIFCMTSYRSTAGLGVDSD